MNPLIIILGPTASGKTALSLSLAKKFNGAIVSADSRQVYRGLDIGTSKISKEAQENIPHYLIDVADPKEAFTLAHYQKLAFFTIEKIIEQKKLPFLVGGTGLYIDAVVDNFFIPEVPPNITLRKFLENADLESELFKRDPEAKKNLDIKNSRRVIRAIEMMDATRKKWSELRKKGERKYRTLKLGIDWSRGELYQRSDTVIDEMFEKGLVIEVEHLLKKGVSQDWLRSLGLEYRAVVEHWDSQKLKFAQHAYIRRQLTWFRKDKEIQWLDPMRSLVQQATTKIKNFC